MCKPNGKAGIPAACPHRGDCRGCPMQLSAMAEEGSLTSGRANQGSTCATPGGLPGDRPQIWESYADSEKLDRFRSIRAKIIRI
ncbi:hypothetical protein EFR84_08650 [Rhizobium chutanense]|uniref:Uncharacterized protein n=1 Tax=Rhizobium chutanense TaxID=2035448 RepID=A0A3S0R248_9HYPH|nr:hypothetical protein EFR84_08650 [Rhizobium chutanense]